MDIKTSKLSFSQLNTIFLTQKQWQFLILLLVFLIAGLFRVKSYYNRTSVGNNDSQRFIQCSEIPFFSIDFFTSNRPPTITALYKLLRPDDGYHLTLVSEPGLEGSGSELDRQLQPGLDRIVLAQSAISIICWMALATVFTRRQKNFSMKVLSSILILSFAFSPQLADWDGVLLSEPVSFALFALVLAFTIELFFRISDKEDSKSIATWMVLWLISIVLWVFSRDTNSYFILITIILVLFSLLIKNTRKYLPVHITIVALLSLGLIFFIHNQTLRASDRWVNPFFNNIIMHVLPYDDRITFFEDLGMPVSTELMAYEGQCCGVTGVYELSDLMDWVKTEGYSSYTRYLLTHPVWAFQRVWHDLPIMFSENRQPFFFGTPTTTPRWFIPVGNVLHPTSSLVLLLDALLFMALLCQSVKYHERISWTWSILFLYLLINITGIYFVSYLGDAAGLIRHVLVAVMPFRLMIWLLAVTISDNFLTQKKLNA